MRKIIITAFMAAVLLFTAAGCSSETPAEEPAMYNGKTYETCLTELKAANSTLRLLKKYDGISNTMEVQDGDGQVLVEYETLYRRSEDGFLLFSNRGKFTDGGDDMVMAGYQDEDHPGAYYMTTGDYKVMTVYPSAEYETSIANDSALDLTSNGYTEGVLDVKEENGVLLISSLLANESTGELNEVYYYADPQTLELQQRKIITYDEDEKLVSQSVTVYEYDTRRTPDSTSPDIILGDKDGCSLKFILVSQNAVLEELNFTIAKDTKADFQSKDKFKMYADSSQKKKLKSIDVSGESAEVYIVFDGE